MPLSGQSSTHGGISRPSPLNFRGGRKARPNDVFVALMGVTGSGKSSFIELCSGKPVGIGHGMHGYTEVVDVFAYEVSSDRTVYLLDTPGFDDTTKSDVQVLKEIATWLASSFKEKILLSGIIYLHRATDRRMQGSARKNVLMFRQLCGDTFFQKKKVILVTTMWDTVSAMEASERRKYESLEKELKEAPEFWGKMLKSGSSYHRHLNTAQSARQIVQQLVNRDPPVATSLQEELVTQNKPLNEKERFAQMEERIQNLLRENEVLRNLSGGSIWTQPIPEISARQLTRFDPSSDDLQTGTIMGASLMAVFPKGMVDKMGFTVLMMGPVLFCLSPLCSIGSTSKPPLKIDSDVYLTYITAGLGRECPTGMGRYSNGHTEIWASDEGDLRREYPGLAQRIDRFGTGKLQKCFLGAGYDQYFTEWLDVNSDFVNQPWSSGFGASNPGVEEALEEARSFREQGAEISGLAVGYEGAWIIGIFHLKNPDLCLRARDLQGHYTFLERFLSNNLVIVYVSRLRSTTVNGFHILNLCPEHDAKHVRTFELIGTRSI
ncbi:hypothetical protein N7540_003256 [Penicillium herquei]|nr:hypothetical protein N7540_003256 [Penicillium herquei]